MNELYIASKVWDNWRHWTQEQHEKLTNKNNMKFELLEILEDDYDALIDEFCFQMNYSMIEYEALIIIWQNGSYLKKSNLWKEFEQWLQDLYDNESVPLQ